MQDKAAAVHGPESSGHTPCAVRLHAVCPRAAVLVSGSQRAGEPAARHRWVRFLGGVLGILLFAFGAIPALQRLDAVREVRDAVRNAGIDATALFYSESEVSSEAEASIRNAIRYSPHRAERPAACPR